VEYKFSKFTPTAVTQRQIMRAQTKDNVAMATKMAMAKKTKRKFIIQHTQFGCVE